MFQTKKGKFFHYNLFITESGERIFCSPYENLSIETLINQEVFILLRGKDVVMEVVVI